MIDLVAAVLVANFLAPYPEDITDQVCLAIESNQAWLVRYNHLVENYNYQGKKGRDIVNGSIGFYTKDLTGMVNIGEGAKAKSTLIQSYLRLGYPDSTDKRAR